MKKKTKSILEYYGPVELYKDDLLKLINKIEENFDNKEIKSKGITIGDYILDDLDDIDSLDEKFYSYVRIFYHLVFENTRMALVFEEKTSIYINNDSIFSKGLLQEVETSVKRYISKKNKLLNQLPYVLFTLLIPLRSIIEFFHEDEKLFSPRNLFVLIYVGIFAICAIIVVFRNVLYKRRSNARLILKLAREDKAFFEKNKEYIIPGVFTIIGVIIGVILQNYLTK